MNDESESYSELPIDFSTFVDNKLRTIKNMENRTSFDPYQVMLNKKKINDGEMVEMPETVNWPKKDIKALDDFCKEHSILGFNCGRMSPIAAIAFLKSKLGIVDSVSLEERVPYGYTKIGQSSSKPSILHG